MDILVRVIAFLAPISISASQIIYGVAALYLIYLVYNKELTEVSTNPYWKYMLALMLMVFITSLLGDDPARSFKKYKQVLLPLTFFIGYYFCRIQNINGILFWTSTGGAVAAIGGIIRYIAGYGPLDRSAGFFSSPVRYGNIMGFITIAVLCVLVFKLYKSRRELIFYISVFIINFIGLLSSTTRGAILAFIIAIFILFIMQYRAKGLLVFIFFAILTTGIIFISSAYSESIKLKMTETIYNLTDPKTSSGWRLVLWKEGWKVFKEHPLTGVGLNNLKPYYEKMPVKHHSIAHAHNNYIQTLVDHGILGALVILALYLKLLFDQFKGVLRKDPYATIGFLFIIILSIEGLTESCLFDSEICMMFWFLSGALLKAQEEKSIMKYNTL